MPDQQTFAEVVSHPAWAERIAFHGAVLEGEWGWARGLTAYEHRATLVDPEGLSQGALVLEHAPGIVAALNTPEGRRAYARARLTA